MTPSALIARSIQRERNRAGLSLSALAQQAGLAKSTLSQLESGQGNPSIETLWAIANVLGVPFSHLFEMPADEHKVIRASEGASVASDKADYQTMLLEKCPQGRVRDLYRVNLRKGSVRHADPHPNGTVEHVVVISGEIRTGPEGAPQTLNVGDYYRFPADVPHFYESITTQSVIIVTMESTG